jgi:mono/diheme cytochrome c family protein
MNRKLLLAALGIGSFILYFTSCSKTSEDKLAGGTTCDTTNVKYSTQIVAILQDNCYECHQGAGVATSGVNLGDYAHFKVHVDNGDVRSAITHDGKVTPMPYQRAQLPACEIQTIIAWINAGAPNN